MKKEKIIWYTLWGVSFGLVCACSFAGIYSKITQGIILITWTLNGFLLGLNYERDKKNEEIERLVMIIKMNQDLLELIDKKYGITAKRNNKEKPTE